MKGRTVVHRSANQALFDCSLNAWIVDHPKFSAYAAERQGNVVAFMCRHMTTLEYITKGSHSWFHFEHFHRKGYMSAIDYVIKCLDDNEGLPIQVGGRPRRSCAYNLTVYNSISRHLTDCVTHTGG